MDKKDTLKIGKGFASAVCVGMLAVSSLGATEIVSNARDFNLTQTNIVATQTAGEETPEYAFEVWGSAGTLTQGYSTLADAITNAVDGDTIKIYQNFVASQSFTISGKSITIDGQNHTIDNSTWLKNIFTVSDDATLTINNLTIDGGATTWEIDTESAVPDANYALVPLKNFESEARHTASVIKSTGNLIANGLTVQNVYTPNGNTRSGGQNGAAINVTKGTLSLTNSTFKHVAGQKGGAVFAESTLAAGMTEYPVTSVVIDGCLFENNHASGGGGALVIGNVKESSITNSNFIANASTRTNGGAFLYDRAIHNWKEDVNNTPEDTTDDVSISGTFNEFLGLANPLCHVENCLFENNWCGNDGFAIENECAEMTIIDSQFIGNVGPNDSTGCVGTISYQVFQHGWVPQYMEGCLFENNRGATSGIGDHACNVELVLKDTQFKNNSGVSSLLIYHGQVELDSVTFENEKARTAVIDARAYAAAETYGQDSKYSTPSLVVKDTTITGTEGGTDIMVRAYGGQEDRASFNVTFEGETKAEIEVKNNGSVTINSDKHTGNITLDATASEATVTVSEESNLVGEVKQVNVYTLTMQYPNPEGGTFQKAVYIEEGTVLNANVLLEFVGATEQDGYVLNWYSDSGYTTLWNFVLDKNYTLYGRWDEHEHNETGWVVRGGVIHKSCTCGKETEEYISITAPTSLTYDGTEKGVTLTNEIGALDTEYTVTYYVKQGDEWTEITTTPKNAGEYKAVLTYAGQDAEVTYKVVEPVKNNKWLKLGIGAGAGVVGIGALAGILAAILKKKKGGKIPKSF